MNKALVLMEIMFLCGVLAQPCGAGSEKVVKISEANLRRRAVSTVLPPYPAEAIKTKTRGVVVIQIKVDGNGVTTDVEVLQAPSGSIADAAVSAVRQWKFEQAAIKGEPVNLLGKLTFYFELKRGKARVRNPLGYEGAKHE
jgi:protein TonB